MKWPWQRTQEPDGELAFETVTGRYRDGWGIVHRDGGALGLIICGPGGPQLQPFSGVKFTPAHLREIARFMEQR